MLNPILIIPSQQSCGRDIVICPFVSVCTTWEKKQMTHDHDACSPCREDGSNLLWMSKGKVTREKPQNALCTKMYVERTISIGVIKADILVPLMRRWSLSTFNIVGQMPMFSEENIEIPFVQDTEWTIC